MSLIFTVPYAGYEVLTFAIDGKVAGAAYDPLSTSPPATWLGDCEECLRGSRRVPLKVRRAVRCLATLRAVRDGFNVRVCTGEECSHVVGARKLQGNWVECSHVVGARKLQSNWVLTIRSRRDKSLAPLVVAVQEGVSKTISGHPRDYRGPVLLRTLRMLLTAREASGLEVQAVLQGLPSESQPRRHGHDDQLVQVANYAKSSVDGVPRGVAPRK